MRPLFRKVCLLSAVIVTAGFIGLGAAPAQATSTSSVLHGFAAVSSGDVWATGYWFSGSGPYQTLAEHWNGLSWQIVSAPSPGSANDFLNTPAALASNDVWVVGSRDNSGNEGSAGGHTLIEHFDGTSWSVVPSPSPGDTANVLRGIVAVSSTNIWAGGFYQNSGQPRQSLIEHFDGISWSVVPSPNTGNGENSFSGLSAASASDIWAVGTFYQSGLPHSLAAHWNGTSWNIVPSPSPGIGSGYPQGTLFWASAATAANDVWAVGQYYDGTAIRTLTEHWNGTSWSVVQSPNATSGENQLRGIVALASNNVWAVGWSYNGTLYQTLVEHWEGTSWSIVSSPNVGSNSSYLKGIASISAIDMWAGAYSVVGGIYQTPTEHWDGTSWSIVSSPNAGGSVTVPGTPTLNAIAGNAVVHLSWTAPSDGGSPITNYKVYRGTASGGETLLATLGSVTSYDDTALSSGTTYFYEVRAVNAVGEGPLSNEASATPVATTVPGAPVLSASSASGRGVILSWTVPSSGGSPITGYRVYRGRSSGVESFFVALGNVTRYKDTATTRGVTYYYRVSAVNAVGEGPLSNEASAVAT